MLQMHNTTVCSPQGREMLAKLPWDLAQQPHQTPAYTKHCIKVQLGTQQDSCVEQALRARADAGDRAAALELAEDDELFRQHMDPEELQRQNRVKIRRVDPTVNLAADGFDRWSEGTTARDFSKVGAPLEDPPKHWPDSCDVCADSLLSTA